MISENKNIEKFIEEINKTADAAVASIQKETEKYVSSELRKAKRQAMQQINAAQFSELDKLIEKNNTSFSEAEKDETTALLKKRQGLTDSVFDEVNARIAVFTASPDYESFLQDCAENLRAVLGSGIFLIRSADEKYAGMLKAYCDEVRIDNTIRFGGIRAVSAEKKLSVDDTLDSRLAEERQKFYERSGLSVTL